MVCNDLLKSHCLNNNCGKLNQCAKSCDCRSIVVCNENNKVFELTNDLNTKIYNYIIDGGVISDETIKRCDYAVCNPDNNILILVELKGCAVNTAVMQIESTLSIYERTFANYKKYARIICQSVPNIQNIPSVLRLAKKLSKEGGTLVLKTQKCSETISSLL